MNPTDRNYISKEDILDLVIDKFSSNDVASLLSILLNESMKLERNQAINASPYERTTDRKGYANGFKTRSFNTRFGETLIEIPQVRGMKFYPRCLEKGVRSERALKIAIAEMYIQGVSTRKVTEIVEALCGLHVTSTQVSRCAALLDEELDKFRQRPLLENYVYVYLDATYEKVRYDKSVRSMANLIAIGVRHDGRREIIGMSSRLSEAEVHWRDFLKGLRARGLCKVDLFVSDAHEGLRAALEAVFSNTPRQRCVFHMAQNAQGYAPRKSMREEVAEAFKSIYNSNSYEDALLQKERVIKQYSEKAPDFVRWIEANVEEGLTFMNFPKKHWKKIRTTNPLERQNREIKRRTKVVTIFPNVASCERLLTALLLEVHEDWISGKSYINMNL